MGVFTNPKIHIAFSSCSLYTGCMKMTRLFYTKKLFFILSIVLSVFWFFAGLTVHAEEEAAVSFDPRLYIYFAQLSEDEQAVYAQAVEEFSAGNASFSPNRVISLDSANRIMRAVCKDQPQLFWLNESFQYEYRQHLTGTEEVTSITADFYDLADNLNENRAELESQKDSLIGDLYDLPAWQQEKYVHDRLASMITYSGESSYNQTLYSALCQQETVCAGYAKAFQYLMTCLGVPCYYCEGSALGSSSDDTDWSAHAWNIICLDGRYYNVDLTWDDTSLASAGLISYAQYNHSDSTPAFADTHVRDDNCLFLPVCDGDAYTYESLYGIPAELGALTWLDDYDSVRHISDIYEYDSAMQDLMIQYGTGEHTFRFAVYNQECNDAILHDENYRDGYLSTVADALYLGSYNFSIQTNSLSLTGGYYLVTITVDLS